MTGSVVSSKDGQASCDALESRLLSIACWVPAIAFFMLIGFAAIAAMRTGHWPYYSHPDPKDLQLPVLHAGALLAYPLALVSIPLCLFIVILGWASLRRRDVIVFGTATAAWAFILPITGQLFVWLID